MLRVWGCSGRFRRLDGSGRPAELVGVAQPVARGPSMRCLGGEAAVGRVWPHLVVVLPPSLDDAACLVEARENLLVQAFRSDERRVGKECVSTCRSRWSRYI